MELTGRLTGAPALQDLALPSVSLQVQGRLVPSCTKVERSAPDRHGTEPHSCNRRASFSFIRGPMQKAFAPARSRRWLRTLLPGRYVYMHAKVIFQ